VSMIIIPEIERVVLLVPRTGSGSLRRAIAEKYPRSFMLYRHMEADGVPQGYDRWPRLGVVRNPVARLWSLYKFLPHVHRYGDGPIERAWEAAQHASVRGKTFEEWLLTNETPFVGTGIFAITDCRHAMPENRKSQWVYLRPDLGTKIIKYPELARQIKVHLDVDLTDRRENASRCDVEMPELSAEGWFHVAQMFRWDMRMCEDELEVYK